MYTSDQCTSSNLNSTGDEYHYILICSLFQKKTRIVFEKKYSYMMPSMQTFVNLFCSTNETTQRRIGKLVDTMKTLSSTLIYCKTY